QSGEVDPTDITISVKNGEVTLTGTVDDRHEKHRAEDLVVAVLGVKDVHNQLRVQRGGESGGGGAGGGSGRGPWAGRDTSAEEPSGAGAAGASGRAAGTAGTPPGGPRSTGR